MPTLLTLALFTLAATPVDRPTLDMATPLKKVTYLPSANAPMVSIRLVFDVGSADDPPGKEGLAALTASLVAEGGTETLSYSDVLERFYPMSAALSGTCRKQASVFQGDIHRDNLDAYAEIVNGMLTSPRFSPEDFDRIKTEAVDYLSKTLRGNNDEELGKWTLQTTLYAPKDGKPHPFGHVDRGTVRGLKAITLEDVKAFHKSHYTAARLHLGVSGGASAPFVKGLANRLAQALPASTPVERRSLANPTIAEGLTVKIVEKPAESSAISIGTPIDVTRADDDFYALAVVNSYLGEHRTFNGKLMQDLRGKRGLNYGDYSYLEDFIQDGFGTFPVPNNPRQVQYFSIWVRPVPADKAAFALRAALWEWNKLVEDGMSDAEFEATRSFLLNYSKLWVQTPSRRLGYAMDGAFYGRDDVVTELGRRLPGLTTAQVNAAIRKHLAFKGFVVAIVAKDASGLKAILTSGKPTPLTYDTQGTPAEILDEDKAIAAYPLKGIKVEVVPVAEQFEK